MCRCFCNCKVLRAQPCCVIVSCTVILVLVAAGAAIAYYWPEISGGSEKKNWTCLYSSCKICEDLEEPSIHLKDTMCANITYLTEDTGFVYIVSANKSTIVNETFTDPTVPPACFNVDADAKACFLLYDINASNSSLHICARIQTTKKLNLVKNYELGCTDIHPSRRTVKNALKNISHFVVGV